MSKTGSMAVLLGLLMAAQAALAQSPPPSLEALWEIVQAQRNEIDELRAELQRTREHSETTRRQVEATGQRVEATGAQLDTLAAVGAQREPTTIGGYGELHYSRADSDAGDSREIDFHRFVLFAGHEFTDRVRFFSELEVEHSFAGGDGPGEVELEQAYVDFGIGERMSARTGLFLLPVGILNETHEPNTFYGVERNDVESIILPGTWWEAGAGLSGYTESGIGWDVAVHSGLAIPTEGSSAFRVRSGRQKAAEALANDPAYTLRLRYTGIPGLELAASYQYQVDPSQVGGDGLDSGRLLTAHVAWQQGPFALRALYGRWDFDGAAVEAAGADRQDGWYLEPSYRLSEQWGVYTRYEDLDAARLQDRFTQAEFGFNFWPVPGVVLKMDYRTRAYSETALSDGDFDAVDLGFGYSF